MKKAALGDLSSLVGYLDGVLRPTAFSDWDGARNGLQCERAPGPIRRVVGAVDSHEAVIRAACEARADVLIVHHGLFWQPTVPWTKATYRKLRLLTEGNLAVYASHLPLDAHPQLGNNILLARALKVGKTTPFFACRGQPIGRRTEGRWTLADIAQRLRHAVGGPVQLIPGGPKTVRSLGIVTGGAGNDLAQAAAEGVDTLITGEGSHWTYGAALELGINLLYAGHYGTETFGVRALLQSLERRFDIETRFLDFPSGL
jgi:dinuclear metal center YbgI/SA1388 family protein